MVAYGEGAAEGGTALAVVHVGVGKEEGTLGGESAAYVARLADEAVVELCAIDDGGSCLHHDILHDDVVADVDGGIGSGGEGAVDEA